MNKVIHTKSELSQFISGLQDMELNKPLSITVKEYSPDRRSCQNRLAFLWFSELGKQTGHGNEYERQRLKLCFAVQILRRDSEEFESFCLSVLDPLAYSDKLSAMEFIQVSSLFNVKQFAEFLTDIDSESSENGYILPKPEDLYFHALTQDSRAA